LLSCSGVRQGLLLLLSQYLFAISLGDIGKLYTVKYSMAMFVVLYANDIVLMAPIAAILYNLLLTCEMEYDCLDISINIEKTRCMRIPQMHDGTCANVCLNIRKKVCVYDPNMTKCVLISVFEIKLKF